MDERLQREHDGDLVRELSGPAVASAEGDVRLMAPWLLELCHFGFKTGTCFHRLPSLTKRSSGAKRRSEGTACGRHASTRAVTLIKGDKAKLEAGQTDADDAGGILQRSSELLTAVIVTIPLLLHD